MTYDKSTSAALVAAAQLSSHPHVRPLAEQLKAAMEEVERLAFDNGMLRADAKTWSCPDCAFTFCAYHTNEDGTLTCPLCELMAANKRIEALTPDRTSADIQRLADVVLDYMERNGVAPQWSTETLCRMIKGGQK